MSVNFFNNWYRKYDSHSFGQKHQNAGFFTIIYSMNIKKVFRTLKNYYIWIEKNYRMNYKK